MKIAVCYPSFQLPKDVNDLDTLWDAMLSSQSCVTKNSPRYAINDFSIKEKDKKYFETFGAIDSIASFDADYFNFTSLEARSTDPQHRLLLKHSAIALENAGYPTFNRDALNCGVYMGICGSDYSDLLRYYHVPFTNNPYFAIGNTHATATGRISRIFNLTGPSVAYDTACSSSGVALHSAIQGIVNGDCDIALVAASNLILSPVATGAFMAARMLSPSMSCKPFSKAADGYVRSEALVALVIKPLEVAQADKNQIYCIIESTSINQDGLTPELTSPNIESQAKCLSSAIRLASLTPGDISYAEAHGTGTSVGDTAEIASFNSVFDGNSNSYIGTSKSIFGHTETTASLVGLIYTAEILRRKIIPTFPIKPHERVSNAFTNLHFADTSISITGKKIYASISGYGFSGTNFSCVISNNPEIKTQNEALYTGPVYLSGYSKKHLSHQISNLQLQNINSDYIHRINLRSSYFQYRAVVELTNGRMLKNCVAVSSVPFKPNYLYINSTENVDLDALFNLLPTKYQYLNDGYKALVRHKNYDLLSLEQTRIIKIHLVFIGFFSRLASLGVRITNSYIDSPQTSDSFVLNGVFRFDRLFSQLLKSDFISSIFETFQQDLVAFNDHSIYHSEKVPTFTCECNLITIDALEVPGRDSSTSFTLREFQNNYSGLITELFLGGGSINFLEPILTFSDVPLALLESDYWFDDSKLKGINDKTDILKPIIINAIDIQELNDHRISSRAIVPFSFYMTKILSGNDNAQYPLSFENLRIHEPLIQYTTQLEYKICLEDDSIDIYRTTENKNNLVFSATTSNTTLIPEELILNDLKELNYTTSELYENLKKLGVSPGESLKKSKNIFCYQGNDVVASIKAETLNSVIDSAFQVSCICFKDYASELVCSSSVYLPSTVKKFVLYSNVLPSYIRVEPLQTKSNEIFFNFLFYSASGICTSSMTSVQALKFNINPVSYPAIFSPKFEEKNIQNKLQANIPSNINTILILGRPELLTENSGFTFTIKQDIPALLRLLLDSKIGVRPSSLCYVISGGQNQYVDFTFLNELVIAIASLKKQSIVTLEIVSLNQYHSKTKSFYGMLKAHVLSLALEFPALNIKYVDISERNIKDWIRIALGELLAFSNTLENDEPIVIYNQKTRYTLSLKKEKTHSSLFPFFESRLNFDNSRSNLYLEKFTNTADNALTIRVLSSGINFRDFLVLENIYTPKRKGIGTDFFGQIVSDSEGHYSPGDYVIGISQHALASVVKVPSNQAVLVPKKLEHINLSGFPLVFLSTIIPATLYLDALAGKNILVHNASGGLGLTVCHYLISNGANIYATTHGSTKQNYLRDLGISYIADSRQKHTYFADVKLDGVFYTLHSSLLDLTLNCLKDGATVIDYTLDAAKNRKKVLEGKRSFNYIPFNLEEYLDENTKALGEYLPKLFTSGALNFVPVRNWSVAQTLDAFDSIEKSNYIGKNIIQWPIPVEQPTILVSGGGGDFARFLIEGHTSGFNYVLFGRRSLASINGQTRDKIDGRKIQYFQGDVTKLDELYKIKEVLDKQGRDIVRIYHFAGALISASVECTEVADFNSLYETKYQGAKNLETVFDSPQLQEFVLASSITALLGSPEQTAYAAANGSLEAFSNERSTQGLCVKLIYFPPIEGTQMVESMSPLSVKVFPKIPSHDFMLLLERALKHPEIMISYFDFNVDMYPVLPKAQQFLLANYIKQNDSHEDKLSSSELEGIVEEIMGLTSEKEQLAKIFDILFEITNSTIELPNVESYNAQQHLSEQGLDSLSLVELSTLIEDRFNVRFNADAFNKETTLSSITILVRKALVAQKDI